MAESRINAPYGNNHELGSAVIIGASDYTIPSDGYFVAICQNTSSNFCYGYVNGVWLLTATTPANAATEGLPRDAVFVRKGSRVKVVCNNFGSSLNRGEFYPLI